MASFNVGPVKVKWIKITDSPGNANQRSLFFATDHANYPGGYFPLNSDRARRWAGYLLDALYNANQNSAGNILFTNNTTDAYLYDWTGSFTKGAATTPEAHIVMGGLTHYLIASLTPVDA